MNAPPELISTEALYERLTDPDLHLVDVRPVEAYNGWPLKHEARGGHIRGARSLPHKWIRYLDWLDIVHAKDLVPGRAVVVYGYDREETGEVAARLQRAGHEDVRVYHGFVDEWSAQPDLPLDHLPRYQQLVSAAWVHELVRTGQAPTFDRDRFVICHAHYRNRGDYEKGHIPGAVDLDTNALESPETWNRRSPAELAEALCGLGITSDTTVVLYGRFSFPDNNDPFPGSSAGHLGAIRCAFIMLVAGVRDVRILNGGWQSWMDAGFEVSTDEVERRPALDFGTAIPACPELVVDTPGARALLQDPDGNLVSVRSWREFIGETSGYHYIQKRGRIPGAVFGNCGSDAYHMENYRNLDHTMREYHEIARIWSEVGVTPDRHNAFYCGTGWRGSEAFFHAWLMGWPRVSVYDGGWFEWSADESNPVETGVPG